MKRRFVFKNWIYWFWVNLKEYPGHLIILPLGWALDLLELHWVVFRSDGASSLRPALDRLKDRIEEFKDTVN